MQCNTNRHSGERFLLAEIEGLRHFLKDAFGKFLAIPRTADFSLQDGKFIAPETREPVAAPKDRTDALRRGFDQAITGPVTEGIGDPVEPTDVWLEQGECR